MSTEERKRKKLGVALSSVFLFALFMGAGPGLLLVNRAAAIRLPGGLELPYLYAWGLLWYAVEAICVVLACLFWWKEND